MASTNNSYPDCPNCNKHGLAILPVRYAVVPPSVSAMLPEPLGDKVTSVKLAQHKYALRTLRQGFLYLFYEKHARGSHIKWETFRVDRTGTLWKQLSIAAINSTSEDPACARTGHNIPASVIAIERPAKCGKVWLAFSQHPWSMDTFKHFENDRAARDRRMQVFEPAKWITGGSYQHGLEATGANVAQILEYKDKSHYVGLSGTDSMPAVSEPDGKFNPTTLEKRSTRYPLYNRKGQTKDLVALMKQAGQNGTENYPPAIIALWDAVGITHELSGFGHDVLGWVDKYNHERQLEVDAMNAIEGLKKAIGERAVASDVQYQRTAFERTRVGQLNAQRRHSAAGFAEPRRSQMLEVCGIIDDWANKGLNYDLFEPLLMDANLLPEPGRSVQIKTIRAEVEGRVGKLRAGAWEKYAEKLDLKHAYENFQRHHRALHNAADGILEARTGDLIAWLESPSLIAALSEFHPTNVHDGAVFEEQVAEAICGMNGSRIGGAKLDEWIRQPPNRETNLVWRAIALNQQQAMEELQVTLQEASAHQASRTLASTLNWVNYASKSLKAFADTFKKVTSFQTANETAMSASGSIAFGVRLRPVNMRGADKLAATVGDRIFRAFSVPGLADHVSEKIIQHIFSLRAFVDPQDSANLIEVQAHKEKLAREQQLQRLNSAKAFMAGDTPAIRTAQAELLRQEWEKLKTAGLMKDARLALLVMLIEGVNFNKLLADCAMKNDAKSWWSLAASGITITSALFDVASVPSKAIFKTESWNYQKLKLAGGVLSSSASTIGAVLDFKDALKSYGKGSMPLFALYSLKGGLGLINAGLTGAATFTYAAPLIGRLTGHSALGSAAKVVGGRAAAILGMRILFMSAGVWITVFTFGIQVFIWVITEDAIEEWCSLCAFGCRKTSRDAYRTSATQAQALAAALHEIGFQTGSENTAQELQ